MSYHLKNGNLEFEVGKKEQSILKGAMYWSFEKEIAEKTGDKEGYQQAQEAMSSVFHDMEQANIPNWVGNAALEFGRTHDLRGAYMSEFFEKSKYADVEKSAPKAEKAGKDMERD